MRPKKDIAKDQMDMAPFRKGGRARRYAAGGDLESGEGTERADNERSFERIGKSALEEGEEEFRKEIAKRRGRPTTRPPARPTPRTAEPASARDTGEVPVGEDERTPRADTRPQARQPSMPERMLEALPAGAAGMAGAAALGRMASRAMMGRRIADSERAARETMRRTSPSLLRKEFAAGGSVSSASSRADGCAQKGKTKGRII